MASLAPTSLATTSYEKIAEWITLLENWLTPPEDSAQLEQWLSSAEELAYAYEFSPNEEVDVDQILNGYEEQFRQRLQRLSFSEHPPLSVLDELLSRKQTEQRTEAWYRQMSEVISASELGQLFAAPRQRAKLVVSKTTPYVPRNAPLAVYSDQMSAFDWGIRFEPVVKQIYEDKYGVTMKELGRLAHPTQPTCMASPDGLVYHCPKGERTGRLIEIKCPVTREIDGVIPKDYYTQMQMQLHVTGLKHCDYLEAEFASPYGTMAPKEGPAYYSGFIALVFCRNRVTPSSAMEQEQKQEQEQGQGQEQEQGQEQLVGGRFEYHYSPLHVTHEWEPMLSEGEEMVEKIPWRLMKWSEQLVIRKEEWWDALQPMLRSFWEDVERAKRGEFVVPESTRPSKRAKTAVASDSAPCLIQFQRLDENGQPYHAPERDTVNGLAS